MAKIWGLRWDDRNYNIGDILPNSRDYDEMGETGEMLPGTSAVMVSDERDFLDYLDGKIEAECGEMDKYNERINIDYYEGAHLYLVYIDTAWDTWEYGNDEGEIIMSNPEVARVIR